MIIAYVNALVVGRVNVNKHILKLFYKLLNTYFALIVCEIPLCNEDPDFCTEKTYCDNQALSTACQNLCGLCGLSAKTKTTSTTTATTTCPPLMCDNGQFNSQMCECICFPASTGKCE